MQRVRIEYATKSISSIKNRTKKFIIILKESILFLFIAIFTYGYLIYTGLYIYTLPAPDASRSEILGVISILIGLVGLLYTLYSAIASGKQLDQSLKDLGKMQIDYWNARGMDKIKDREFFNAIQSYQMAIKINPLDVRIWINIASSLFRQKKYDAALDAIKKAIAINPEREDAWNLKAMIFREKAIDSMEYNIEIDTEITSIKFFKIDRLFPQNIIYTEDPTSCSIGNHAKLDDETKSLLAQAELAMKKAIELKLAKINEFSEISYDWQDKDFLAGIWSNLGTIYSIQRNYKKAIDTFNKAIELNPKYAEAWIDRGHALLSEKRLPEAIDSFDKAIKIDHKNSRAWSEKGYTYKEMDKTYMNDAIHAFDKSLEFDPFYLKALSGKGAVLFEMGKYDEAIKVVDVALEVDPFNLKMCRNKCVSLLRLNKYEESIKASNRAIKLYLQYAFAWYKKYEEFYIIRKDDEAIRAYDNYLELMEEISAIHNIIGDATFNSSLRYPTRLWDALIAYNAAINLNPINIYSWICKSMVLYILGFANESKNAYLRAYRLKILSDTPHQYIEEIG